MLFEFCQIVDLLLKLRWLCAGQALVRLQYAVPATEVICDRTGGAEPYKQALVQFVVFSFWHTIPFR